MLVEYLYLDLQVCDRCIGTEQALDEVLTALTPVLRLPVTLWNTARQNGLSAELAQQYRFESSPTVRVNGQDICFKVAENACDCCSDISGPLWIVVIFEYEGQNYEVPPQEMLAEAILKAVFGSQDPPGAGR